MTPPSLRQPLLMAALASMTGGILGHGIFFVARDLYGFDDATNLLLAVVLYVPYVPAALSVGWLASKLGRARVLVGVNLMMAIAGILLAFHPPAWALWWLAALYNTGAGMLWPLIEAGVARGRSGASLRQAIGAFNLTWALTLSPGLWLVALANANPAIPFGALAALHLLCLPLCGGLGGSYAHHHTADGHAAYRPLLKSARVLLPLSYLLLDTLVPLLPGIWARLGVDPAIAPLASSTWMLARLGTFAVMIRSERWHGRWALLGGGAALLLCGAALVLLGGQLPVVGAGLLSFGVGQGMIYYAALFYGMEVGKGEVEAGGWHEAVIGLGYLGGPLLAWVGLAAGTGVVPVVGVATGLGMIAAARPWWRPTAPDP